MAKINTTHLGRFSSISFIKFPCKTLALAVVATAFFLAPLCVHGQAPSVVWETNVNARIFAVDAQTNSYAATNGTVVTLDANGIPFKTNSICPVSSLAPGLSLRDSVGNFYFAGNFDGTNDFGGTNLIGGWINGVNYVPPRWVAGYPTCFLAKYGPNDVLLWATTFGTQAMSNYLSDLVLNSDDSVTLAVNQGDNSAEIAQFSAYGTNLWQTAVFGSQFEFGPVKVSGLTGTNGAFLLYRLVAPQTFVFGTYSSSGVLTFKSPGPLFYSSVLSINGEPVTTPANEIYSAALGAPGSDPILEKVSFDGTLVWTNSIGSVEQTILGGDAGGNLYLSGVDGSFSKYNAEGAKIWTTNYGAVAVKLVIDSHENRFIQLADNTILRLSPGPGLQINRQQGDGLGSTGFQFTVNGDVGDVYQLLWSTDLVSWQSMGDVTNQTDQIQVLDTNAASAQSRFYRIAAP